MKKRKKFYCDTNGGIIVVSALRYALDSNSYVPAATQDWILDNWSDLTFNIQVLIVRDIFEHLIETKKLQETFPERHHNKIYDNSWLAFAVDRYWSLDYNCRKEVEDNFHVSYTYKKELFIKYISPKIYELRTSTEL